MPFRRFVLSLVMLACAAFASPVLACPATADSDVAQIIYTRLQIDADGTLTYRGNCKWLEENTDGRFNYVEKSRTDSKIVLRDIKRQVTVIVSLKIGGTLSWIWNGSAPTPYARITSLSN